MTRVGVISQARMTSTRLPGKVLLEAGGASMLAHQVERLAAADLQVYVATTTNATDEPIVAEAQRMGVSVYRGSEDDVLRRFAGAAREFELDVVVRVTSDCPLIDGAVVREGVERFIALDDPRAHVSNVIERTYPRGFDFEVFSAALLFEADEQATSQAEREHVTPYLYANPASRTTLHAIRRDEDASNYRVTLDTGDDLELIRRLIEQHDAAHLNVDEIVTVLEQHPELARLNVHVEQKKLGA